MRRTCIFLALIFLAVGVAQARETSVDSSWGLAIGIKLPGVKQLVYNPNVWGDYDRDLEAALAGRPEPDSVTLKVFVKDGPVGILRGTGFELHRHTFAWEPLLADSAWRATGDTLSLTVPWSLLFRDGYDGTYSLSFNKMEVRQQRGRFIQLTDEYQTEFYFDLTRRKDPLAKALGKPKFEVTCEGSELPLQDTKRLLKGRDKPVTITLSFDSDHAATNPEDYTILYGNISLQEIGCFGPIPRKKLGIATRSGSSYAWTVDVSDLQKGFSGDYWIYDIELYRKAADGQIYLVKGIIRWQGEYLFTLVGR